MVKPHSYLEDVRPDEVAECWEGVSKSLYAGLWRIASSFKKPEHIEDIGPHDVIGIDSVTQHWSSFTEEEQIELNKLATLKEKEFRDWMSGRSGYPA